MRRFSASLRERRGLLRAAIVLLVLVTAVAAAIRATIVVDELSDEASANSALSYSDREIAGGNALVVQQEALYQAVARIPEDETFRVAVGEDYDGGTELTRPYVESFYRYFLIPRRMEGDARWVVCYGCDLGELGESANVVWRGSDDISIVELAR